MFTRNEIHSAELDRFTKDANGYSMSHPNYAGPWQEYLIIHYGMGIAPEVLDRVVVNSIDALENYLGKGERYRLQWTETAYFDLDPGALLRILSQEQVIRNTDHLSDISLLSSIGDYLNKIRIVQEFTCLNSRILVLALHAARYDNDNT